MSQVPTMLDLRIVEKTCSDCSNHRKFVVNTPRDKQSICGNCWDWFARPPKAADIANSRKI